MENKKPRRLGHQNLNVWKKSMELAAAVGELTQGRRWSNNRALRDQIQRSAISVPSNIAEGEDQSTNRASIKFYFIARGSLSEVRSQLALANLQGLLEKEQKSRLEDLCETVGKLIAGVLRVRREREEKG
jgi:four helix bundle protein